MNPFGKKSSVLVYIIKVGKLSESCLADIFLYVNSILNEKKQVVK